LYYLEGGLRVLLLLLLLWKMTLESVAQQREYIDRKTLSDLFLIFQDRIGHGEKTIQGSKRVAPWKQKNKIKK
jgi:hypothetical protein